MRDETTKRKGHKMFTKEGNVELVIMDSGFTTDIDFPEGRDIDRDVDLFVTVCNQADENETDIIKLPISDIKKGIGFNENKTLKEVAIYTMRRIGLDLKGLETPEDYQSVIDFLETGKVIPGNAYTNSKGYIHVKIGHSGKATPDKISNAELQRRIMGGGKSSESNAFAPQTPRAATSSGKNPFA